MGWKALVAVWFYMESDPGNGCRVLWGEESIGETTPSQLRKRKSKQKVRIGFIYLSCFTNIYLDYLSTIYVSSLFLFVPGKRLFSMNEENPTEAWSPLPTKHYFLKETCLLLALETIRSGLLNRSSHRVAESYIYLISNFYNKVL